MLELQYFDEVAFKGFIETCGLRIESEDFTELTRSGLFGPCKNGYTALHACLLKKWIDSAYSLLFPWNTKIIGGNPAQKLRSNITPAIQSEYKELGSSLNALLDQPGRYLEQRDTLREKIEVESPFGIFTESTYFLSSEAASVFDGIGRLFIEQNIAFRIIDNYTPSAAASSGVVASSGAAPSSEIENLQELNDLENLELEVVAGEPAEGEAEKSAEVKRPIVAEKSPLNIRNKLQTRSAALPSVESSEDAGAKVTAERPRTSLSSLSSRLLAIRRGENTADLRSSFARHSSEIHGNQADVGAKPTPDDINLQEPTPQEEEVAKPLQTGQESKEQKLRKSLLGKALEVKKKEDEEGEKGISDDELVLSESEFGEELEENSKLEGNRPLFTPRNGFEKLGFERQNLEDPGAAEEKRKSPSLFGGNASEKLFAKTPRRRSSPLGMTGNDPEMVTVVESNTSVDETQDPPEETSKVRPKGPQPALFSAPKVSNSRISQLLSEKGRLRGRLGEKPAPLETPPDPTPAEQEPPQPTADVITASRDRKLSGPTFGNQPMAPRKSSGTLAMKGLKQDDPEGLEENENQQANQKPIRSTYLRFTPPGGNNPNTTEALEQPVSTQAKKDFLSVDKKATTEKSGMIDLDLLSKQLDEFSGKIGADAPFSNESESDFVDLKTDFHPADHNFNDLPLHNSTSTGMGTGKSTAGLVDFSDLADFADINNPFDKSIGRPQQQKPTPKSNNVDLKLAAKEKFQADAEALKRGNNWLGLVELIENHIKTVENPDERQQLCIDLADIYQSRLNDPSGAMLALMAATSESQASDFKKALSKLHDIGLQKTTLKDYVTWLNNALQEPRFSANHNLLRRYLAHANSAADNVSAAFFTLAGLLLEAPHTLEENDLTTLIEWAKVGQLGEDLCNFLLEINLETLPKALQAEFAYQTSTTLIQLGQEIHAVPILKYILKCAQEDAANGSWDVETVIDTLKALVHVYQIENNWQDIVKTLDEWLEHLPPQDRPEFKGALEEAFARDAAMPDAIERYTNALNQNPNDINNITRLAQLYANKGKPHDAVALLRDAYKNAPSEQRHHILLRLAHIAEYNVNQPESALNYYKQINQTYPCVDSHKGAARLLHQRHDWRGVVNSISYLIEHKDEIHFEERIAYINMGLDAANALEDDETYQTFVNAMNDA